MGGHLPSTTVVRWSRHPEMVEFMRGFIPGHQEGEIRAAFLERFGVELNEAQIGNFKVRYCIKSGTHGGRFEKGHAPANKGRTWDEMDIPEESRERMRATQFKRGGLPWDTLPVGAERVTKNGYIEVHVAQRRRERANDQWVLKQRLIWERANGRRLGPGEVVLFADGDKLNFDPGNLVAVTQAENMGLQRIGRPYCDRATLMAALDVVRLDTAISKAEKHPRRCKSCGRTFNPRFKRQARCDECIRAGR